MVKIVKSEGIGQTKLGAYYNALRNSGIKNYETKVDIMTIPNSEEIEFDKYFYDYGEKIKVLIAHHESDYIAEATISWANDKNNKILISNNGGTGIINNEFILQDIFNDKKIETDNCTQLSINDNSNNKYICAMVVAIEVGE